MFLEHLKEFDLFGYLSRKLKYLKILESDVFFSEISDLQIGVRGRLLVRV